MGINPESSMGNHTELSFERQQVSTDLESLTQMTSSLLEDSMSNWFESIERMRTNSKPLIAKCSEHTGNDIPDLSPPSPVISLLSLDSCDLEIQMLIDADQTQDGPVAESLQMEMIDSFDLLYCSDNQEDQHCIQNNSSLNAPYDTENLTRSAGGSSTQEFEYDSQIMTMLGNSVPNLDQKSQELSLNQDRLQSPVSYSMSQNNIPEDHYRQLAPCMMTNRKESGYLESTLSVSNQTVLNCVGSSHHTFPEMDCQSKQIPFDNWEQRSGVSTYKNYSQGLETPQHLMLHDTNIRNVEKNIIKNDSRTGSSGFQCSIMDRSCFEGLSYDKRESCSYSKFRANQSTHNFEGVARSFPAKVHKTHPNLIPTPPPDDDWLFSNIMA
ncbi:uncharacterized protein [Misgurnus anguillicaudatus]|uniref:uncharacterized protein n=1 Tax=Misgurnus anguillicaudatus TaxID=75329 RepID=UPI003CCF5356